MVASLTKELFNTIISDKKSAVVDVYATWCGPCMYMKPVFHAVAEEMGNGYTFAELNVDEQRELAITFGVSSVPTFVFIKEGSVVAKEVGAINKEELIAKIKKHIG